MSPSEAAQKALTLFDDSVDAGLIILSKSQNYMLNVFCNIHEYFLSTLSLQHY
jgi:hypothetical protein